MVHTVKWLFFNVTLNFRFDLYSLTPTGKEDEAGIKKAAEKCMLNHSTHSL